jgi:hypothetical protein
LVSGVVEAGQGDSGRFVLVRSRARIFARTKRVIVAEIPLVSEENVVVGRKKCKKSLIFFGKMLKLQENYSISGDNCDIIRVNRRVVLLEGLSESFSIPLPICIISEYEQKYDAVDVVLTEEEAMARAEALASEKLLELEPEEIISRESYYEVRDGVLVLVTELELIEDIATEAFIGVV